MEHNAHYCAPKCSECTESLTGPEEDDGSGLCESCRPEGLEKRKREKYLYFISRFPELESLCEALVPNQLYDWEQDCDMDLPWSLTLQKGCLFVDFDGQYRSVNLRRQRANAKVCDWSARFQVNTPLEIILSAISTALATGEHESKL